MNFYLSRWIFIRGLCLVYLTAFLSASHQMMGLYGQDGILPIAEYIKQISAGGYSGATAANFFSQPTVFWVDQQDMVLLVIPIVGVVASLLALVGILTGEYLFMCWFLYLSIVNVGQDFMSFQWDTLLLETGFLALFFTTWRPLEAGWRRHLRLRLPSWCFEQEKNPLIVLWLYRWLLFRLMFSSGIVKLASGDPTWHNLTALCYHYETQPLPTPLAWFCDQAPREVHVFGAIIMFIIELVVPFSVFLSTRPRHLGALIMIAFQVAIMLTGNYCYFNWLTILLCVLLFDDGFVDSQLGATFSNWLAPLASLRDPGKIAKFIVAPASALILFVSSFCFMQSVMDYRSFAPQLLVPIVAISPWHISSSYGLFAIMTTTRPEIEIEGSEDGINWRTYEFKYKIGPCNRIPPTVAPVQPRLDWQMWFQAISPSRLSEHSWFVRFLQKLLDGSPSVTTLLEKNPFPDPMHQPKMLRANFYNYEFTQWPALSSEGLWWKRTLMGEYLTLKREDTKANGMSVPTMREEK